jgi:hypothetical protein
MIYRGHCAAPMYLAAVSCTSPRAPQRGCRPWRSRAGAFPLFGAAAFVPGKAIESIRTLAQFWPVGRENIAAGVTIERTVTL